MTAPRSECERAVLPPTFLISGAFTTRERCPSAVEFLFNPFGTLGELAVACGTARVYKKLGQVMGSKVLIIPNIGSTLLWGLPTRNLDTIYDEAALVIAHKKQRHSPDKPIVLVGHSLGGTVASRFAHEHPGQVKAVVTIGTPFRPVTPHFIFGSGQLEHNTGIIQQRRRMLGEDAPAMHTIASTADIIVGVNSALPTLPLTYAHLLTTYDGPELLIPGERLVMERPPGHLGIVDHVKVLEICKGVRESRAEFVEAA